MAPKKAALATATSLDGNATVADGAPPAAVKAPAGKQTVEQKYQKLTHLEHILKRPDTYVGSLEMVTTEMPVVNRETQRMEHRKITYVPGLYKIFDEICVNAADNKQRDASMTELRINIDRENNKLSVYNNGKGIPVVMHQEHNIWVPELIFGHLLAGSNFDDDQQKTTGGRNGYGAKLCNIFSTEFTVETADSEVGKSYKQTFHDNMARKDKPKIKEGCKDDWTRISWKPDLAKFGMETLDDDCVSLFERRAYDLAGCTHHTVKVYLNDKRITVNNFSNFVDLFLGPKNGPDPSPRVFEKVHERWEVAIAPSDDGFQQFSFVNSIATTKGGTHVDHVANQVVDKLLEVMKKKHKGMEKLLKPNNVKAHMKVFVNCLVVNPTFDSQTKEFMSLKQSAFGSKCTFSDKFYKDVLNCGVMESLLDAARAKADKELDKKGGKKKQRLTGIAKLDDANEAGGKNGHLCTLLITEGDSAKALAVSGLAVVGRDHYGVFPLRGKLINVRDANHTQVMNNKEITELVQIIGLQYKKDYSDPANRKALRYGHLMVMTDQDHDGSHIKGLIINFLHYNWPQLLKTDFLREFVTPIVKVSRARTSIPFFTLKEYNDWREKTGTAANSYQIKYYKGLGTSTSQEAKEYFSDLNQHELSFHWEGDGATALIERAFSKSMADARKEWLRGYDPEVHIDHSSKTITYGDFINKELIHFSNADNVRSIPSMVDGLKPGQRKILFACFKRGKPLLKHEIKVAQLAGYVSEHSAYHHGETSLAGTIVGMAQTFVGSNNIALLYPAGQFGTRLLGGKDAASPRYIFTKLPALTRLMFHPDDDAILEYLEDDGQSIEPKFYMPVVPLVLINGSDGIGTGWSSSVPNYNPREIVANLKRMIEGEAPQAMTPWYRGFTGSIVPADTKHSTFTAFGTVSKLDDTTVLISELPIKKWTNDFKESVLEPMLTGTAGDKKCDVVLDDVREHHTDTKVSFTIRYASPEAFNAASTGSNNFYKSLKLSSSLSTSNMTLFNADGAIERHEDTESIMSSFFTLRLEMYQKRKQHLTDVLTADWSKLDNRVRFVLAVISGEVKISNVKKDAIIAQLERDGYKAFEPAAKKKKEGDDDADDAAEDAVDVDAKVKTAAAKSRGYDYLLGMPLWSLTMEKVVSLRAELAAKDAELQALLGTEPTELWVRDLDAFLVGYDAWEAELAASEAGMPTAKGGKGKGKAAPKKAAKRADSDDDSDDDFEGSDDDDWGAKKKKKAAPKKGGAPKAPPPPDASDAIPIAPPEVALAAPPKRKAAGSSRPGSANSNVPAPIDSDDEGVSLTAALSARTGVAVKPAAGGLVKPTAVKAARSASAASSNESMEVDDDDYPPALSESPGPRQPVKRVCDKPSPTAVAARPGRKAKEAVAQVVDMSSDDDFESGSDDDEPAPKPVAKAAAPKAAPAAAKAPAKAPAKAKPKKAASSDDDESDAMSESDDEDGSDDGSEFEDKPPPKKAAAKPKPAAGPKAAAAPKPAAAPKKAAAKKAEASDSDDIYSDEEAPPPKKAPPKKAAPKAAAAPKPAAAPKAAAKKKAVDSESDGGSDSDAEVSLSAAVAARATARPGRAAAAKVSYTKYAESEDESAEEASEAEEGSGSDYAE